MILEACLPYLGVGIEQLCSFNFALPCNITHVYASGTVRLPMFHRIQTGASVDSCADNFTHAPVYFTLVNRDPSRPLIVSQPQREGRRSYVDRQGRRHEFAPPPPGPHFFTLRGGLRFSWAELAWSGEYRREFVVIRASEDFEPVEGADNG